MHGTLERVIAALDFSTAAEALRFVSMAGGELTWCKVGMELFTKEGPPVVEKLKKEGKKVFLDLKYHDIPNTVRGAVVSAGNLGVDMLTIHASGGAEMMCAAAEPARERGISVVAVTVLTSLNDGDLMAMGHKEPVSSLAEKLTQLALSSGVDGIVCSPREVRHLKALSRERFIAVTPGIRLPDEDAADQKRVTTPEEAFRAGADYIVVGRSLTGAPDPAKRLEKIAARIAEPSK